MCGIVCYAGERKAAEILLEALRRLDYRGYDSAGMVTLAGGRLHAKKDKGKIGEIHAKLNLTSLPGSIGIGHTRWATHGAPSKLNAHPQFDCTGKIAVIHNGVIENYAELKHELVKKGHKFTSETDTEVIAHLIEENLKGRLFEQALKNSIRALTGSYALAVLHSDDSSIYLARELSPLVIGVGKGEIFCASDIPALLSEAHEFVILEDGEMAVLNKNGFTIEKQGRRIHRAPIEISWSGEMAKKGGYPHFTIKEINEQPSAIRQTLEGELSTIETIAKFAKLFERMNVVGCGTSYHAALLFSYLVQELAGIPCSATIASEFRYGTAKTAGSKTLVLAISQSGETTDTLVAVREAKRHGAKVLALTNVLGSSITREADNSFYTHAGPEIGVVATKTFSAQLAALSHLAFRLAGDAHLISELVKIPSALDSLLKRQEELRKISKKLCKQNDFFFIGRGFSYPVALEGALKLKEISYVHAEAYPGGELKHGPLSLIEEGMPLIAIAPSGNAFPKMLSNIAECKARGAKIFVLSDSEEALAKGELSFKLPKFHPALSPIISVIPLQLLAYNIAVMRGLDPDKPRHLAKSVTVE